jgi:RNA-binding protein YhbY
MTSEPIQFTLEELKSAIYESAHSDFYLGDSGLNEYILLKEINRRLKEKQLEK